jgi:elongator complex protein 3
MVNFFIDLLSEIETNKVQTKTELDRAKKRLAKKHGLEKIPKNSEILKRTESERARALLMRKPTRSLSGVTVIALMTAPSQCPGSCIYCPGGEGMSPKSYTGFEPAAMRAGQYEYDAFKQVQGRIKQLERIGHTADKIELIFMGGTFTALPLNYQESFVKDAIDGVTGERTDNIEESIRLAGKSDRRISGETFEIRPDHCSPADVKRLLGYGATRVELGVQTIYDDIYEKVKRGHTVQDVIEATKLLKDSGLKVCYHMMPGLPHSSRERDIEMFKELFENPGFKPDMLKIYPCLLVKREFMLNDEVYGLYIRRAWNPLTNEQAADIIAEAKKYIPEWVRVMRIQRDVPRPYIEAGVTAGNLRELVAEKAKCKCIRCREVGRVKDDAIPELTIREYEASRGSESFISFETEKALHGFLRLRKHSSKQVAFVRELHVYGEMTPVGKTGKAIQHKGMGTELLRKAEEIASGWNCREIFVNSGIGVREYYKKRGYTLKEPYMWKRLP